MTVPDPDQHKNNIASFPDAKTRERLQRLKEEAAKPPPPPSEPVLNLPPVTRILTQALLGVYLAQWALPFIIGDTTTQTIVYNLSFISARLTGALPFDIYALPSIVTHMFLHAGWLHLGMNTLCLMAFGAGLEKWIGGRNMAIIALLSGVAGVAAQTLLDPFGAMPMLGASGAISGMFGAVIIQMQAQGHVGGGFKKLLPFIIFWVLTSVFFGMFGVPGAEGSIAWAAHLGGFFGGLLLCNPVIRWNSR